jgi:hypothetical protein
MMGNYPPGSNAAEFGVLVAEPEDIAVVGDHLFQTALMLRLVHLAQEEVQGAQG